MTITLYSPSMPYQRRLGMPAGVGGRGGAEGAAGVSAARRPRTTARIARLNARPAAKGCQEALLKAGDAANSGLVVRPSSGSASWVPTSPLKDFVELGLIQKLGVARLYGLLQGAAGGERQVRWGGTACLDAAWRGTGAGRQPRMGARMRGVCSTAAWARHPPA
jgi:hypothetical protein